MTGRKENQYRLLWMLGLALTLPMILLSGPLAGFLIAEWLIKQFHMSTNLVPILAGLGLIGSAFQSFRLIQKLNQNQK